MASYLFADVAADHKLSASFAPGLQTGMWISIAKSVVTYRSSTLLRGELSDQSVQPPVGLGGRDVIVEQTSSINDPSSWAPLGTYQTSSQAATLGQFSLKISPEGPTYYRLHYVKMPLSSYGGVVSEVRKLSVRPLLGKPVAPKSVKARHRFVVSGSLKPRFTRGQKTVTIKVYRYKNHHWVYKTKLSATNVDSGSYTKYRLKKSFSAKGKYRFKATSSPTGWTAATTRFSRTLVVK